jgi:hypothetical protein
MVGSLIIQNKWDRTGLGAARPLPIFLISQIINIVVELNTSAVIYLKNNTPLLKIFIERIFGFGLFPHLVGLASTIPPGVNA